MLLNLDAKLYGTPEVFRAPYSPSARYITQRFERSAELVFTSALALRRAAVLASPPLFRERVLSGDKAAVEMAKRLLFPCHVCEVIDPTAAFYEANVDTRLRADAILSCHRIRLIEEGPKDVFLFAKK